MTHSPGPWVLVDDHNGTRIKDAEGHNILSVNYAGDYSGGAEPTINNEGDAYLLRAAPKLLEALKLLMHEVDESGNGRDPNYGWPKAVSASREAIAEAEGE